jgi:CubicO group peptidase (beta-lactamase class C family)
MLLPVDPTPEQAAQADEPSPPDGLLGMTFNVSRSGSAEPLPNIRAFRASGQAAAAGVGSARGLARLYAMCLGEVDGFPRLLTDTTIAEVAQIQTVGEDLVLRFPTRFGVVFQKYDDRSGYGSHQAFGHDGAGGSIGVADPWHGIAYAWIPRRMSFPGGGDTRGLGLAKILRECAAATPKG